MDKYRVYWKVKGFSGGITCYGLWLADFLYSIASWFSQNVSDNDGTNRAGMYLDTPEDKSFNLIHEPERLMKKIKKDMKKK